MQRTQTILLSPLLALLWAGCMQTGEDLDGADLDAIEVDDSPEPDDLRVTKGDDVDEPLCQEHVAPTLGSSWPTVERDEDLVTDGRLQFLITNEMEVPTRVDLWARIVGDGAQLVIPMQPIDLGAGERRELELAMPAEVVETLARFQYSAQLEIGMTIPMQGERPLGPFLSEPVYLHVDNDNVVLYDEHGLRTRHRAGDIGGRVHATLTAEQRQEVVSIGAARLERVPDEIAATFTEHASDEHEGGTTP
jgi:hypothetical protein